MNQTVFLSKDNDSLTVRTRSLTYPLSRKMTRQPLSSGGAKLAHRGGENVPRSRRRIWRRTCTIQYVCAVTLTCDTDVCKCAPGRQWTCAEGRLLEFTATLSYFYFLMKEYRHYIIRANWARAGARTPLFYTHQTSGHCHCQLEYRGRELFRPQTTRVEFLNYCYFIVFM